jgi:hypothetical protein
MKAIFAILFLFTLKTYGQSDSVKAQAINRYTYQIDAKKNIGSKPFKIKIDTLDLDVQKYEQKFEIKTVFGKGRRLELTYYLKESDLAAVWAKEFAPGKSTEIYRFLILYYENGERFYDTEQFHIPLGIRIPVGKDVSDFFDYTKLITRDFINELAVKSLGKILNHR